MISPEDPPLQMIRAGIFGSFFTFLGSIELTRERKRLVFNFPLNQKDYKIYSDFCDQIQFDSCFYLEFYEIFDFGEIIHERFELDSSRVPSWV